MSLPIGVLGSSSLLPTGCQEFDSFVVSQAAGFVSLSPPASVPTSAPQRVLLGKTRSAALIEAFSFGRRGASEGEVLT